MSELTREDLLESIAAGLQYLKAEQYDKGSTLLLAVIAHTLVEIMTILGDNLSSAQADGDTNQEVSA